MACVGVVTIRSVGYETSHCVRYSALSAGIGYTCLQIGRNLEDIPSTAGACIELRIGDRKAGSYTGDHRERTTATSGIYRLSTGPTRAKERNA